VFFQPFNNITVCRSTEPIDIKLNEDFRGDSNLENKKPVLEIITKVSTAIVSKKRRGPPPPPQMYDDDEYEYDRYPGHLCGPGRYKSDDNDMKITNVEERVMIINSTHLVNALKAVVAYYPGSKLTNINYGSSRFTNRIQVTSLVTR
jgi:hypothetical protein